MKMDNIDDEEILNRLINLIITNCNLEDENKVITSESKLSELGINSIDYIKIVVAIEIEFGFEFDDNKLTAENFVSVKDLCAYIKDMINEQDN